MNKLTIITALILLAAVPIAAGQLLPWWAGLLVLVVEITLILIYGPLLLANLFKARVVRMFKQQSRVLEGAQVVIHQVIETAAPELDSADNASAATVRHVMVDFTLTPAAGLTGDYGPADLSLVPGDADDNDFSAKHAAYTEKVRLIDEDGQESSCDQLSGPARLRIWFGIPAALTGAAKFCYYFARFGSLSLP